MKGLGIKKKKAKKQNKTQKATLKASELELGVVGGNGVP